MKNMTKAEENALFGPEDHEAPIVGEHAPNWEKVIDAHADLMHHTHDCAPCNFARYTQDMCEVGKHLYSISKREHDHYYTERAIREVKRVGTKHQEEPDQFVHKGVYSATIISAIAKAEKGDGK